MYLLFACVYKNQEAIKQKGFVEVIMGCLMMIARLNVLFCKISHISWPFLKDAMKWED